MKCYVLCSLQKLIYHQLLQLPLINSLSLSHARAGGIVANVEHNVSIGHSLLFHPEGKKPACNGSYRIDGATFPVEDAGGILFALHNRQIQNYLASHISDLDVASVIAIKGICDVIRPFACFFRYGSDISFREVDQIGFYPELLQPFHGNEIIKIQWPLVMAARSAPLALKSDIIKNGLHHDARQEIPSEKRKKLRSRPKGSSSGDASQPELPVPALLRTLPS
jgi:hypothetical protein